MCCFELVSVMPPKSKRVKSLQEAAKRAREAKRPRLEAGVTTDEAGDEAIDEASTISQQADARAPRSPTVLDLDEDSNLDPTFNPEEELTSNPNLRLEQFVEEWALSLDREDRIALGLYLSFHFERLMNFTQYQSADYAGIMLGKSERTIRQWLSDYKEIRKW